MIKYINIILYYIDEFAYLIRYSKFCTTVLPTTIVILMNMPIKYGTLNFVLPLFDIRTRVDNIKRYTIDFKIASTQHNTVQVYMPIK